MAFGSAVAIIRGYASSRRILRPIEWASPPRAASHSQVSCHSLRAMMIAKPRLNEILCFPASSFLMHYYCGNLPGTDLQKQNNNNNHYYYNLQPQLLWAKFSKLSTRGWRCLGTLLLESLMITEGSALAVSGSNNRARRRRNLSFLSFFLFLELVDDNCIVRHIRPI